MAADLCGADLDAGGVALLDLCARGNEGDVGARVEAAAVVAVALDLDRGVGARGELGEDERVDAELAEARGEEGLAEDGVEGGAWVVADCEEDLDVGHGVFEGDCVGDDVRGLSLRFGGFVVDISVFWEEIWWDGRKC